MFRLRAFAAGSAALLLLLGACKDDETRVAEAAAEVVKKARMLGPDDRQFTSLDRTVALEVVGDSVHVLMANSLISVPATHIENLKYSDGRLRFDIKGLGTKIFEVGDGREGAVFTQGDALQFVAVVMQRQNDLEKR